MLNNFRNEAKLKLVELDTKLMELFMALYAIVVALQILVHPGTTFGVAFLQSALSILHLPPICWFLALLIGGISQITILTIVWTDKFFVNPGKYLRLRGNVFFFLFFVWSTCSAAIFTTFPRSLPSTLLYALLAVTCLTSSMCLHTKNSCVFCPAPDCPIDNYRDVEWSEHTHNANLI